MKKIYSQINTVISDSHHILLHLHPGPDADSIGSALAFYHYLISINKKVTLISGDSNISPGLATLPGANQITPQNFFDINLADFDLFIILDSSEKRQISKLNEVIFPKHLKTIVIDHHASNQGFGDINLIETESPATCQVVFKLFKALKINISKEIAICLFTGIFGDTGGFKYSSTSAQTFSICAQLTKIAPNFTETLFNLENNDRPERPKLLGLHLSHIETYFNDHIAISALPLGLLKKNNINPDDSVNAEISNTLKSVVGWEIGISMIESGKDMVRASFRTRDPSIYDLSKIATDTGYGGGHKAAAGASLPMSLSKAKRLILRTISRLHPELGEI